MSEPASEREPAGQPDGADRSDSADEANESATNESAAKGDRSRAMLNGGLGRVVEAGLSGDSVSAKGVLDAIGGWRGVVESLLPATIYLVVYVITRDPRLSAIAPLVLAGVSVLWRLVRKETLTAALSGVVGVVVCVAAVMFSGEGSSYFVPGFFINGAWILAHTVSLLIGWPLIGLLLGFLRGSLTDWRTHASLRHAAQLCTVIWIAVFAARLAVQLPLYFAAPPFGSDQGATEALGIARLVMGVPLFALAVLFTWLVLSRVSSLVDARNASEAQADSRSSDE